MKKILILVMLLLFTGCFWNKGEAEKREFYHPNSVLDIINTFESYEIKRNFLNESYEFIKVEEIDGKSFYKVSVVFAEKMTAWIDEDSGLYKITNENGDTYDSNNQVELRQYESVIKAAFSIFNSLPTDEEIKSIIEQEILETYNIEFSNIGASVTVYEEKHKNAHIKTHIADFNTFKMIVKVENLIENSIFEIIDFELK